MANPWNRRLEMQFAKFPEPYQPWKDCGSASSQAITRSYENHPSPSSSRKSSVDTPKIQTRSYSAPFGAGVIFERDDSSVRSNDDAVVIVVVRLSNPFRRRSIEPCDELPSRPQPRSFLKRLGTRWHGPAEEDTYKAIKMPRGDYKRYFARDKNGNYAGTEPERQWGEADVMREFAAYQDLPLHSILC